MFLPADRGGVGVSTFWMTWVCEQNDLFYFGEIFSCEEQLYLKSLSNSSEKQVLSLAGIYFRVT